MNPTPAELQNVSVVVLSDGNNPALLNPDFLTKNGIVPSDWAVRQVLVTPPIATVAYENGVSITVEETKLQIVAAKLGEIDWQSELPQIVIMILKTLPHVNYRSVGLNLSAIRVASDSKTVEKNIIDVLVKDGPWLQFGKGISGAQVKLHYREDQPTLQFDIQSGKIPKEGDDYIPVYVFSANFHHDFLPSDDESRISYIEKLPSYESEFLELVNSVSLGAS